ncbi:hypothetical protein WJX74_008329 [Apatococcus lobatus]|uniref:DNA repair protein RAD51 homolog 3 n=2 Tax=Apatococcus TaxID=904362 RepID=A0AAW1SS38_9CHLO
MTAIPRRSVALLPLPNALQHLLMACGYRTTADFDGISSPALAHTSGIPLEDASAVLQMAQGHLHNGSVQGERSARALLEERPMRRIITFCSDVDQILGGGVALGQLTELCGVPGVGKTQLGMQLAVDVQIPYAFGGLGGTAVYIDTEGSFAVERVEQVAEACMRHLQKLAASPNGTSQQADAVSCMDKEGMLANIHLFRVTELAQQMTLSNELDLFISQHPLVKLVVFDSVTFHFRQDSRDLAQRARVLAGLAQCLTRLAAQRRLAVVIMNQVTTKVSDNDSSHLIPALGDSWAHASATQVLLSFQDGTRQARIYKSPSLPERTAEYLITADGVRGRRTPKRPRPDPAA